MEEAFKANTDSGETLRQKETNTDLFVTQNKNVAKCREKNLRKDISLLRLKL